MTFLNERVFDPILRTPDTAEPVKQGVRLTITKMRQRDVLGMMQYY